MTLEDCVLAIRRFCARRGTVDTFYSDNAKTFVAASKVVQTQFGLQAPKWKFIVPRSPWWGGWWERLVRSVKVALRKSLGTRCLSRAELETCLHEVEACINSRPLTFVGDERDSPAPLTPSHFLIGRGAGVPPKVDNEALKSVSPASFRERYTLVQQRLELFWDRWRNEYLRNLPTSVRGTKGQCNLKVGSVVLVQEDNTPRMRWPLGVVRELYPGSDGILRSVCVKTAKGEITRSVQRLHDLEIVEPVKDAPSPGQETSNSRPTGVKVTRSGRIVKQRKFDGFRM